MSDLLTRLQAALGDAYRVERELGGGGMSRVFVAIQRELGRRVVIKVLPPEVAAGVNLDRFRREIHLAASLQHPHIVPLLAAGQAEELLYYTMPLIEGESLRAKLAREGALPVADAVRIMRDVVDALAYAHRHGVVHRDIKPDNVLIADHHAVVTDFGVAKALSESTGQESLTSTGVALGTPAYMAPEQAAGDPHVDRRCDLYAVGALAYEMLTGRAPFSGGTAQQILAAQVSEAPQPVTKHRATVAPALAHAVMRCLEKNPADRWQSAEEFLHQLEAMVTGSDGSAPSIVERATTPVLVPRWAATLVALGALGAVVAEWGPWRPAGQATVKLPTFAASVAVLPFETIGGVQQDAYFSEGMTDEIITQLAQIRDLKVISRTSVVALKGSHLTLSRIADTLGVDHVLEGSVRRAGGRVRVNAQLIAAKTDAHLWARTYERDLKDVFRVQEEIAGDVSRALLASVQGLRPLSPGSRTEQPAAYDAYLRGTYWRQLRTRNGLLRAIEAFQAALAIDSAYAPAYAGLSSALSLFIIFEYPGGPEPVSAAARAIVLADRAIALDSNLAEGFAARGFAFVNMGVSLDTALRDLARAVALRPNSGEAHGFSVAALADAGRDEDGFTEGQTATDLSPLAPGSHIAFSNAALVARRYDLALREARRAAVLETAPLSLRIRFEGLALLLLARPGECLALDLGSQPYLRAMCLEALGRHREAAAIVDSLAAAVQARHSTWGSPEGLGMYYAWVGDVDASLRWYEAAFRVAPPRMLRSGVFDKVRNNARFRAGIARLSERNRARLQQAIVKARAS